MRYKIDATKLEVYTETEKRRHLVGVLEHDLKEDIYIFQYELKYLELKTAIPVGPDLPFHPRIHKSKPGRLFATFLDRIPPRENAAYPDYCASQGVSPDEANYIILLATIGRRGPSSFVFESIFIPLDDVVKELKKFREKLSLSRWDFAMAFDFPEITIVKVEYGETKDANILRLIDIMINYPEMALEQLEVTGKKVHADVRTRLYFYFKEKLKGSE